MSPSESIPRVIVPRGEKLHGTDWWAPLPGEALNAAIPYIAQIVDDALSITERIIYYVVTAPENRLKNDTGQRGYVCDPGGYTRIAKRAGVCRKTARNTIKSLERKAALREFRLVMRGKQREKTIYWAAHFGDLLPMWRADPAIWKTAATPARVAVIGRRKQIVTVEMAAERKMNPDRAPLRGSGRGRSEFAQAKREAKIAAGMAAPAPEGIPSDALLHPAFEMLVKCCESNLKDAIDLVNSALAEARRLGNAELPPDAIPGLTRALAMEYKPSREFPLPKPKWFIDRIGAKVIQWIKFPETRSSAKMA